MSIVRFAPFQTLDTIREQLARTFEENSECCTSTGNIYLPLEVSEDNANFYVKTIVPGLNSEDISIEVENGLLSISCETKAPELKEGEEYHLSEFCYGKFRRALRLGNIIDSENIVAEYKSGILSLTVPKSPKALKKTVKINNVE